MPKITAYYDYAKLLSYNGVYNFCIGGRGLGKTYGAKKKAIIDAIKRGDQFIYLRRYKTEIKMSATTFFADIQHEFPDYDFRGQGMLAQMSPASDREVKKRQWQTIGYFMALVVAQTYKGVSFPDVKTIIFDEFIIEKGALHYLPDEATVFNNFFSTVDRYKDKTRVFFLANSVKITNPYFITYKIRTREADKNGIIKKADGFLIVHLVDSAEFENQVFKTKFGQFIEGTEYADYAVNNEFADDGENLIKKKPASARPLFTLETVSGTVGAWYDMKEDTYYATANPPKDGIKFTLIDDKMDETKLLITFNDKPLQMLRTAYRKARLFSDQPSTRNAIIEIFKR